MGSITLHLVQCWLSSPRCSNPLGRELDTYVRGEGIDRGSVRWSGGGEIRPYIAPAKAEMLVFLIYDV